MGPYPHNVYVFHFFHTLAGRDGKLPAGYAASSTDSHPNAAAAEIVASLFVQVTFDHALQYESLPNRVAFSSFHATITDAGGEMLLEWTTSGEFNNRGLYVQRGAEDDEEYMKLSSSFIVGSDTTSVPERHSFDDSPPSYGSWGYRLRQIGF
jgi:hypothetical protein